MKALKTIPNHPFTIDIIGERFGKIIVESFSHIKKIGLKKKSAAVWNCLCDCGQRKKILGASLKNGLTTSCGCSQAQIMSGINNPKWSGYKQISGSHWDRIKASAKQRNLEFSITIQDAWYQFIKQNRICALSGVKLRFNSKCIQYDGSASLDRIDSSKGYILDNIQWIDKIINIAKQDSTDQNFIEMCHKISDYQRSKNLRD